MQSCDAAHSINKNNLGDFSMIRCLSYAFTAIFKSRTRLTAENLCLRLQLIVLKRRQARPQLRDADRRFWILACQLFSGWYRSLIVVKPDTVVGWHRKGWKAYWRWRSSITSSYLITTTCSEQLINSSLTTFAGSLVEDLAR